MRLLPPLAFFLLCLLFHFIHALPADSDEPVSRDTSASGSTVSQTTPHPSADGSTTKAESSTPHLSTHKATTDANKHHAASSQKPTDQITVPVPTRTGAPTPSFTHFHPHPAGQHHQSIAVLIFEIVGVLAGVLVMLGIIRCLFIYHRTPQHDRVTAILHRHQLQREMEELERNPPQRDRNSVLEPPPPPYLRPPDYEDESTPLSRPRPNR
ncbi:hypothetical protein C8F01DRAFT_1118585 [Mycena amicta]|nr:hypothetical protein C8F01DRAFT_1118585 [Mycena amicta]